MLELVIETWSNPAAGTTHRWSLWQEGTRVGMGGPHRSVAESEAEGTEYCAEKAGRPPDRVTCL